MVGGFILRPVKVVHGVVEQVIVIAAIVEAGYPHGLFSYVLLLFSTDHVNFAAHLHGAVESVD